MTQKKSIGCAAGVDLSEADFRSLRQKLVFKIRFHVGGFCPDVEDLVQESLARFVNALNEGAIQRPERAGAFLNGICNNVIREYRRRVRREPLYDSTTHGEPSVDAEADRAVLGSELRTALLELLPRDAAILREFYLEQKSKEEICWSRGLTDAQFRVILFRAKERFRSIYMRKRNTALSRNTEVERWTSMPTSSRAKHSC
jgi:RNA polymerase sigma-70 factor, ECF subfamily